MEKVYNDNVVVGHYKGMPIIENEHGLLYYASDLDENLAPVGTIVEDELMELIHNLPEADRLMIEKMFGREESLI